MLALTLRNPRIFQRRVERTNVRRMMQDAGQLDVRTHGICEPPLRGRRQTGTRVTESRREAPASRRYRCRLHVTCGTCIAPLTPPAQVTPCIHLKYSTDHRE